MSDAPEQIWADPPDIFDGMGIWHEAEDGLGAEYIRADVVAAERDAAVAQAVERAEAKIALLQRALERTDEGLDYMGLYAPTPAPAGKEGA